MKPHLAAAACALVAASVQAQTAPGSADMPLRVLLRQPAAVATPTPPRQLSSQERADLRRQLAQYSRGSSKGP